MIAVIVNDAVTPSTNPNPPKLYYNLALLYSLPVILQHLRIDVLFENAMKRWEPYFYGFLCVLAYLEAGPETAFIYFQF